jgi:hypothetical protein
VRWEHEGDYAFPYAEVAVKTHSMTVGEAQADGATMSPRPLIIMAPFHEMTLTVEG